jgi:hypothetical protein
MRDTPARLIAAATLLVAGCGGSSSPQPKAALAASLTPPGAQCAVDVGPIAKLLGANLAAAGSEDKGGLVYCYYRMSAPSGANLRLGLLKCRDLQTYFSGVAGDATPTTAGGTAGQVKYDATTDPPSGRAVAIAGIVGARADVQTADPTTSFSFDAPSTLPEVARMALATYLAHVHTPASSGSSC